MSKDGRTWLSHTSIELMQRCPRCFWLMQNKKIRQPEGIVSRLANRFDSVLKSYFDIYRQTSEIPPMIEGKIEGKLQNPFQEKYFTRINDKYGFWGKLDECIINEKGEYIPVDFKTASTDPRDKEILDAYKSQIDDYLFLLKKNKAKIADFGYLIYFFPDESRDLHKGFPMIIHIQKVDGNPENTEKRIEKSIKVLENTIPEASPACPFCTYFKELEKVK